MKLQLVSHASVIVQTNGLKIWTDPWLFGQAFNDSWRLYPQANFDETELDTIGYVWISHEHPDHFHIPTLRSLPTDFKARVTVLFQENNSEKLFDALRRSGFRNFRKLPHAKLVTLASGVRIYCYQVGQMDSALAVLVEGHSILNINDCEVNTADMLRMRRTLGPCEVLLNQFSLAGYSGHADRERYLPPAAQRILDAMVQNHNDISAKVTIPIASFVYFSTEDNAYMNRYANTVSDVVDCFARHGLETAVLYPGDTMEVGKPYDSAPALAKFREAQQNFPPVPFDPPARTSLEQLLREYDAMAAKLHERYPAFVLRRLTPVTIRVADLDVTLRFSLADRRIEVVDNVDPDLQINSQPLSFAFSNPYGFQTLGVSARYTLFKNFSNWRNHRILFSLNNAEIYLRARLFFRKANLAWFSKRLPGAMNQLAYQLRRMR